MTTPTTGNGEAASEATRERRVFRPLTDIYALEGRIIVETEMPGVEPDDIDVTLERGVLTIRGRTPAAPRQGFRLAHLEYEEGDYERAFTLSEQIDHQAMTAELKNGVLKLSLPIATEAKPRRIEIKTA